MTSQAGVVRRTFFGRLAALSSALVGVATLPSIANAERRAPTHPADAWLDDLKGIHKNIYDCTTGENGPLGWAFARNFFIANTGPIYQLKDPDVTVIVSVRHLATGFGFSDAMWAKYPLGEVFKVNDGASPAVKNPQAAASTELAARGAIVTVCSMATTKFAGQIAAKTGLKAADVEADLKANLVTASARMVAAGVIITNRAQERGFTYTYVG